MNALVETKKTQLPAYLQAAASRLNAVNASAAGGITAGQGFPSISIRASRFRLQDTQGGEEVVVATPHLDVIIVDANPYVSKIFYGSQYDPKAEEKAPDCWSDNGVAPSTRASAPQCGSCAACPHNIWGSKVTNSGAPTKACSDVKKVAVLIADNVGSVFGLRIPPASLKNWVAFIQGLDNRGIPAAGVITRLEFDPQADFPKLTFKPIGWATKEQVEAVQEVLDSEEVALCTGKNDKAVTGSPQNAGIAAVTTPQGVTPARQGAGFTPKTLDDLEPRELPPALRNTKSVADPFPAAETPVLATQAATTGAPKRGRRKVAEDQGSAFPPPQTSPGDTDWSPPGARMSPKRDADRDVPLAAPVTDNALDDLVSKAMRA